MYYCTTLILYLQYYILSILKNSRSRKLCMVHDAVKLATWIEVWFNNRSKQQQLLVAFFFFLHHMLKVPQRNKKRKWEIKCQKWFFDLPYFCGFLFHRFLALQPGAPWVSCVGSVCYAGPSKKPKNIIVYTSLYYLAPSMAKKRLGRLNSLFSSLCPPFRVEEVIKKRKKAIFLFVFFPLLILLSVKESLFPL